MCPVVSGSLQIIHINSFLNWQCPILHLCKPPPTLVVTHTHTTSHSYFTTHCQSWRYHKNIYIKAHTSTDYYKNRVVCALCLTPIMRMRCTMTAQSILQRTFFFLFYSQLIYSITSNCIQAVIGNVIKNYVKRYIVNEMKSIMILNFSARQSAQCW